MPPPVPPRVKDGPQDRGITGLLLDRGEAFLDRVHRATLRGPEPDPDHRLGEFLAVLGDPDGALARPDQLDAVLLEHAVLVERHRHVERGLPAHRGQQRVGPLLRDDLFHPLGRHRLDVGPVGDLRIGHDRRRIRVHQDDPVTLLLERAHRLGARVVELGALADDDRPGADQEDRGEVSALGHRASIAVSGPASSRGAHPVAARSLLRVAHKMRDVGGAREGRVPLREAPGSRPTPRSGKIGPRAGSLRRAPRCRPRRPCRARAAR